MVIRTFYFLFLLGVLSSCNRLCPELNVDGWRRPQVMCGASEWIYDYNTALINAQEDYCNPDPYAFGKVPLTPEDFNPWQPLETHIQLTAGDILDIAIFGDEETNFSEVVIAPDGRLYYTFLDGLLAEGKTLPQLTSEIEEKVKEYFLNPVVTITPRFLAAQSFRVFGRVNTPGIFPLLGPTRLREGIGVAGGLLQEDFNAKSHSAEQLEEIVDLHASFIMRNHRKLNINFQTLLRDPLSREDIFLKPGDYIYLATYTPRQVYVLGNVRFPARLEYIRGITLLEALADVQGWPSIDPYAADISRVMILRGPFCNCYAIETDVQKIILGEATNVVLAPGDVVFVLNKKMRFGRALVRLAISTFIQSFATAAGSYLAEFVWFPVFSSPDSSISPSPSFPSSSSNPSISDISNVW